jgi:hypothetical protein
LAHSCFHPQGLRDTGGGDSDQALMNTLYTRDLAGRVLLVGVATPDVKFELPGGWLAEVLLVRGLPALP